MGCCSWCITAPPPATRSSKAHPRPSPGSARSPWTGTPSRSSASTATGNGGRTANAPPRAERGGTPGTCSPAPTGHHFTPATSAPGSGCSCNAAGYHPCGCTTCATAPPPSPTKPAPTSRPCRICSATPASWSPPTPTPASCPQRSAAAPTPPSGLCSTPPHAPATGSRSRPSATGHQRESPASAAARHVRHQTATEPGV